jgi:subtilisin family serine protease
MKRFSKRVICPPSSVEDRDPLYSEQWAWQKMEAEEAWKRLDEVGELQPVTVAIVDCGIQSDHEDLNHQMISGARVIPPDNNDFSDDDGHGTMLAGTIAAIANNERGGRGMIPAARLMAIKFIDVRTPPTSGNAAKAIIRAVDDRAQIINASWNVGLDSRELKDAIEYARCHKVLVVVAAGNNGGDNARYPSFPASYESDNLISVLATDRNDQKAGFSNYGQNVHLGAPGVDIVSTSPYLCQPPAPPSLSYNPAYRSYSGTSAAAAHVSGAAALLLSIEPSWTAEKVRGHLMKTVDPIPDLRHYCRAGGRLNVGRAVKELCA